MIITILMLIKQLLDFAKKYGSKERLLSLELIESSTTITDMSESSMVFLNCGKVLLYEEGSEDDLFLESVPYCRRPMRLRKELQNKHRRLNALKKVEVEDDGHNDTSNEIVQGLKGNLISPAADCNSNNLTMPKENQFFHSNDSIQDFNDFLQDNSDYQWFLDFGYNKYNNSSHHQSILSLSRSQDLFYYDDVARNIDANVAEVDMDDFNREDIHSVLSSLPNMQGAEEREMFASVTGSMMVKFDLESSITRRSCSQEEQNSASLCKSQLLFSPIRESYIPNCNLSVDSLDSSENDINLMVTCQSNKNNYTIAFEGSTVMISDDSETRETYGSSGSKSEDNQNTSFDVKLENYKPTEKERLKSDNRLTTSDSTFTTWSKLKENPSENIHLKRHPSGNNNAAADISPISGKDISSSSCRSLSLPNLFGQKQKQNLSLSVSTKLNHELTRKSSLSSDSRYVKLYDIQSNSNNLDHSTSSASGKPAHSFSLVKLFIKQKSASHEGMSNFMTEQTIPDENLKNQKLNLESNKTFDKNSENKRLQMKDTNQLIADTSYLKNCPNTLLIEEVNGNEKTKKLDKFDLKASRHCESSLYQDHGFCNRNEKRTSRNSYCSDDSAQENGSNTESAENITCNSIKGSSVACSNKLREKSIQTSKLFDKNESSDKKLLKVPVYILYPNYSLPNLEFLRKEHYVQNIDFSKVFLKPQKFKMSESPATSPGAHKKSTKRRPISVNDIETLKKTGFKHVKDWESLTFLLPKEYKDFLQEIPEIVAQLKDVKNSKEEVVPLFCLSPPPNRRVRRRPNSCDVNISNDYRSSNFSSTATQPSSGYRGSSTMLFSNHSNNTNSPRNPSFNYKYETNSESASSRRSGSVSQNRNYSSNSGDSSEIFPTRPPLPKSILRNNSLDNQQYTCKTQKEYANKRYSMVELTDKNLVLEEKSSKRRTMQSSPKSPKGFSSRISEQKQVTGASEPISNRSSRHEESQGTKMRSNLENDMRKLEELLEISAVFGESVESFTETDMMKLRSQVSKFLTMQKNLEKVSETLQTVDEGKTTEFSADEAGNELEESNSSTKKHLQTPHNTPEHKKQQPNTSNSKEINALFSEVGGKPCNCNGHTHEFEDGDCKFREENFGGLKKTVSFAENISFAVKELELCKENAASNFMLSNPQVKPKRPVDLPICEESSEGVPSDSSAAVFLQNSSDLLHKRNLILDVKNAIKKILTLCKETREDPANICLHHLCPSLYAVLSDGLKEEIETPFGPIRNSVWSVIEASSQQGPMTQTLNELVQRLNREDIFTEGLIKFNAFIFGLLNARALSGWFSYLRTRDSLLHKYYENNGLLLLSNTAGAPVRVLVDSLINILEPLGSLQFNLDLMYQTKLLHCSLQNLNCLLEEPSNSDFLTPTKQFMLLKLVQSIQNSISQSGEGKRNKHILEDIEQKTSDPPVSHLLENKNIRTRHGKSRTRPRSGFDTAATGQEVNDVAGMMKKRWSGVNLNSKLVEAFDKLVDDSESDYTDSLDIAAPRSELSSPMKKVLQERNSNTLDEDSEADMYTKAQKKNILLNLNKKSCGKVDNPKTEWNEKESLNSCEPQTQNGGQKFKRLQQKWERMSNRSPSDSDSDVKSPLERTPSHKAKAKSLPGRSQKSEKSSCDTNITMPSPTSRISKIPRLVTSPLSSTPTPKQSGNAQKVFSPTISNDSNQKSGKVSQSTTAKGSSTDGKGTLIGGKRFSRCDGKTEQGLGGNSGKNHSVSPTSVLPRRSEIAKRNEALVKRASSASLNRKSAPKKLHQAQRTVRTLTHRLPSDSGHLSFNEGERLKVVLDVDKTWLLCCRGSRKGLVPKSLVISDIDDKF